jgi:hypothetical protein
MKSRHTDTQIPLRPRLVHGAVAAAQGPAALGTEA